MSETDSMFPALEGAMAAAPKSGGARGGGTGAHQAGGPQSADDEAGRCGTPDRRGSSGAGDLGFCRQIRLKLL